MFVYIYKYSGSQFYNKYKSTGKRKNNWNKNMLQILQEPMNLQRKE